MWKINNNSNKQIIEGTPQEFFEKVFTSGLNNREIIINSITPQEAEKLDRFIRFWNDIDEIVPYSEREPIKIYINCIGGTLAPVFTMIDSIKLSRTPVYTINIGTVYREAFYLFLTGLKRYSYPRATFYFEKQTGFFDAMDTQSNYEDFCNKQKQEIKSMILENTKITESEYDKRQGWWLTAEQANELKICNEVLRGKLI